MNAHTPTPWQITGVDGYARRFVSDSKGNQVAFCAPIQPTIERGLADAAHIVRCVNSHDALVEALRNLLIAEKIYDDDDQRLIACRDAAIDAIKAATEQS